MGSVPREVFIFLIFLLSPTYASQSVNSGNDMFTPNYTSLTLNVTYHSINISNNSSGFWNGYYDFVLSSVDILVPEALPLGIRTLEDFDSIVSLIPNCIWSYRRFVLFLLIVVGQIIFLIFGIVKTICFLLPSGKTHSYATKSTSWKKRILQKYGRCMRLGWIHSYFTLLVFMIALAHSSNEDINLGTKKVTIALDNSIMDTERYIDTSTEQLEILLTNNLQEYLDFFIENAERTAEEIVIDLGNSIANINLLGSFSGIEKSFKPIEPILREIKGLAQEMISLTDEIVQGVMVDGNALINGTLDELEKGIDLVGNITGDITGGVIGAIEDPDNFTSGISEKTFEDVDKLNNLTTNVVGDVIDELGKSGKILNNITSSIGEDVVEGGKMLTNLTENIGEGLDKTKEAITDLTAGITGGNITANIDGGVDKITNFTEHIGEDIIGGIGSGIDEGEETLSKIGDGIDNVAGNVEKGVGGAIDSLLDFGNSEAKDVTKTPNGSINGSAPSIPGKNDGESVVSGVAEGVGGAVDDFLNIGSKKIATDSSDSKFVVIGHDENENKPKDIVGGMISGAEDTVNNLFDFGNNKAESGTKKPSSESTTIKTNAKNDEAIKLDVGIKNDTVNNIFGLSTQKPDSEKDVVTKVVGGVAGEVGGAVDGLFGSGGKKSDSENAVTQKPDSGKDVVTNVVGGVASEVGGAVDGLFGLGGKKSDSENAVTQKPDSGKDVVTNVVGGVAGEVGGAVDGLFSSGEKKSDSENAVTQKPDSGKDVVTNVVGGVASEVGGAVDGLFGLGGKKSDSENAVTQKPDSGKDVVTNVVGGVAGEVGGAVDGLFSSGEKKSDSENAVTQKPDSEKDVLPKVVGGVTSEVGGAVDGLFGSGEKKSDSENAVTQKPDSGKDVVTNVVGGVAGEVGGAVDGLFGSGGKKSDSENAVTQKPDSGKDVVTNVVGGVASEVGGAVDGLFGSGEKKSDSENAVTQKPDSGKDVVTNVVGGVAGEVGGVVNNIFNSGVDATNSVTKAPTEREKTGGLLGGIENGVEGAVNNVFGFGNNEKYVTHSPSATGTDGDSNNGIDLRNGGTEDEDTSKKPTNSKKEKGSGLVDNVIDEVGGTSKKILDFGDNLLGFRRKRELGLNFDGLIDGFRKIYSTIDQLEHFMNEDLSKMSNISVLLTPIVKEIGVTVRSVLDEVKEDIKIAAKPLEKILDVAKKEVGEVKHDLLSLLKVIFDLVQMFINEIEPIRYFISHFVTYLVLLAFILLIIGLTTRIVRENCATEYMMKGGCTALYVAALIMACFSLVYIGAGVATQKLVCETFQGPNDNGVLDLIDETNPINLGSHFTISVKRIIRNCHKDKSIYEVVDLQKIFDLSEFKKYFNIEDTEKKLKEALDFPLNFTKILPFEDFEKAEEILFGTFKEIMDSPVITAIDSLEDKLGSLPGIGDILKTFTGNLMSIQKNFNTLKNAKSKDGNKSFFDELENAVLNVEKELTRLENSLIESIQKISLKLQHRIIKSLTMYIEDRLIYSIQHDIGRCKPLSLALNSSVNAVCKDISTPANGHWFSWFICVAISIIILIYSSSCRNIPRKNSSRRQSNVLHVEEEEMHTIVIANEAKENKNTDL